MTPRKKQAAPPASITKGKDHMVITPRNTLKARAVVMTDGPPTLDETAIRRAEQALKALSHQFDDWMEEAAANLSALRETVVAQGFGEGRLSAFHRAAHDIRGQATTLGFPLASRVGASLCLILEELPAEKLSVPPFAALISQHVDAIRAITREGVMKAEHPVGERLAQELEMLAERMIANALGARLN
jgi:HPt (histidine-containing phosphotransfer) domain-containing protein